MAGGDYQGLEGQQSQDAVRDNDDLFSRGNRGQRFSQEQIIQFLAFRERKTAGLGIKQRLHKLPDSGFQGFPAQGQRMQVLHPILAHHKNVAGLFTQGIFYEHLVIGQGHLFDWQRFGIVQGRIEWLGLPQFFGESFKLGDELFPVVNCLPQSVFAPHDGLLPLGFIGRQAEVQGSFTLAQVGGKFGAAGIPGSLGQGLQHDPGLGGLGQSEGGGLGGRTEFL